MRRGDKIIRGLASGVVREQSIEVMQLRKSCIKIDHVFESGTILNVTSAYVSNLHKTTFEYHTQGQNIKYLVFWT